MACPPNTRAVHLQIHDDLLLAVNGPSVWHMQEFQNLQDYFEGSPADKLRDRAGSFASGIRVFDVSRPEKPAEIGFMPVDGIGPHRIWYTGGRYAYASIHFADVHRPHPRRRRHVRPPPARGRRPVVDSRACGAAAPRRRPGARGAATRSTTPWSPATSPTAPGATAGLTVLDVADPTRPRLLAHRNWDPPFGGGTHSPLPLPDRNLLVVADEPTTMNCSQGLRYVWMFDVREPSNPVSIATFPSPAEADYCKKGGNFGPHNLHENRPGAFQSSRLIFATYYNAGVRVYDIENPFQPREVGFYVPADPERLIDPRPNRPLVTQSNDCYVDRNGLMYLTDSNGGLNILEFTGL